MRNLFYKLSFILRKKDKINLCLIFVIMFVSAILDLIGISSILPIVTLLNSKIEDGILNDINILQFNFLIQWLYKSFGINSIDTMATIMLLLLAIFFLFKTAYAFLTTYVMTKFAMSFSRRLTKRQMETYLLMPYEYHLNNNSSTLIRKCTFDISQFTNAIKNLLSFFIKSITMLAITTYLFITNWTVTLIIGGALGIFSCLIIFILKPHLRSVSKKTQILNSDNYKHLSQAFNGIKESKISNTESYFINMYDNNINEINKFSLRTTMFSSIPGHSLELIGMLGLVFSLLIVVTFKEQLGSSNSLIIETFAVFAYAIIKLLPCVTEINSTINNLNQYMVSIDSIYNDIKDSSIFLDIEDKPFVKMEFDNEIRLNNVSFAYSSCLDKKILDNISCVIKKNTSVAFTGASGAGKTTIIDVILGLLEPREGFVSCDGQNIKNNIRGWRNNISYVPQTIYLTDDTIRKNIAFGIKCSNISDEKIWDSLEKAELKDFVQNLPDGLNTIIGERGVRLSGGQRQRIGIARAFYRNTNIIVFDEATSALDFETENAILNHVTKYSDSHTIIIITHRLNTIENCDSIYKVDDGMLYKIK